MMALEDNAKRRHSVARIGRVSNDQPLQVAVGPHRNECNGTVIALNMSQGMAHKVDYRKL
jgi:hypothetical protein